MNNNSLICKISFFDSEFNTVKKIIGVVDKKQLFSMETIFIEVKNYENKIISKHDVEGILVYEKQMELVITKNSLEVNTPLKMEA